MIVRQENGSRGRMWPPARRPSSCCRHPEAPISGICAACLRERLNGLDISTVAAAEMRRCRSVVSRSIYEGSSQEVRRKSCDVISSRSSLGELFGAEDSRCGSEGEPRRVDSSNAGVAKASYPVVESKLENHDCTGGVNDRLEQVSNSGCGDGAGEDEEGKFKTMKEFIDLEVNKRTRISMDLREIAGSLVGVASIVSKKLLKWKKNKTENSREGTEAPGKSKNLKFFHYRQKLRESHSPIVGARRSCEYTGSIFPLEAVRISLEQPRASLDGYMIARTIPRLTPMFSMVDDGIWDNATWFEQHRMSNEGTMHSIPEEKGSSRASGSSLLNSDSSSSMQRSSIDRSTSVRSFGKKVMGYDDCGASPASVKLVITEKELKDWNLSTKASEKVSGDTAAVAATIVPCDSHTSIKKPVPWRQICKSLGFRVKNGEAFPGRGGVHSMDPSTNIHVKKKADDNAHL